MSPHPKYLDPPPPSALPGTTRFAALAILISILGFCCEWHKYFMLAAGPKPIGVGNERAGGGEGSSLALIIWLAQLVAVPHPATLYCTVLRPLDQPNWRRNLIALPAWLWRRIFQFATQTKCKWQTKSAISFACILCNCNRLVAEDTNCAFYL